MQTGSITTYINGTKNSTCTGNRVQICGRRVKLHVAVASDNRVNIESNQFIVMEATQQANNNCIVSDHNSDPTGTKFHTNWYLVHKRKGKKETSIYVQCLHNLCYKAIP